MCPLLFFRWIGDDKRNKNIQKRFENGILSENFRDIEAI
jgi:hypothetical protein